MIGGVIAIALGTLFGASPCDSILSGRVVDSLSGKALAGSRVDAGESVAPVRTDREGRFRIEGLCPGPLRVQAVRTGYALRETQVRAGEPGLITIELVSMEIREGEELRVEAAHLKASDTRSVVSLEG